MEGSLDRRRLNDAFAALGKRVHQPTRVLIGGAGALILGGELNRATMDCDVLLSHPDMGQLQGYIRTVAERCGLPSGWLNGSAQTYAEILPPDYESRLHSLPPFGRLQVMVLHRQDVLVVSERQIHHLRFEPSFTDRLGSLKFVDFIHSVPPEQRHNLTLRECDPWRLHRE